MEAEIYYKLVLSFAVILLVARVSGELFERYLRQPEVIGEIIGGIIISPFALGGLLHDPIILNFAIIDNAFGNAQFSPLELISQIAVITLLFTAGLETDIKAFVKQSLIGSIVAICGVAFPFVFGFFAAMLMIRDSNLSQWLFMGAILTATSIGLTARILMSAGMLNQKAGTIIIVAAVIDDIIGIIILSIVTSFATASNINPLQILQITLTGFGAWFILLFIGIKFHRQISRYLLRPFRRSGTVPIVALIIGFLISYLVTLVNLHPVVGAYVAGLLFSATADKEEIIDMTRPIMLFLAPFFFTFMGMQVNVPLLILGGIFAVVMVVLAIAGKVIGCYLPAKLVGKLAHRDAMIVGVGMVPRGEVGLIIAGAGLLTGAISRELFSVAIAVSIVTTLVAPVMLRPLMKVRMAR